MGYEVKDADLIKTKALPAAAGSVQTAGIYIKPGGDFLGPAELLISAPALNTTQLPDTETMTYIVEESDDDSTYNTLHDNALVQTGAGGAGAAAATVKVGLPTDVKKYVRVKATGSTSIGDCSGASVTMSLLM